MNYKFYFVVLLSCPVFAISQEANKGIIFERGLNWKQITAKAKAENKYIFVDCYATWCKPCKEMDKHIYPNDTVGEFFNNKFISVKVQMDTGKIDDDNIKILYPVARNFEQKYTITVLPTYLFFSPDGRIVHEERGIKNTNEFITVAQDALNPEKALYTLIDFWKSGNMRNASKPRLAQKLKEHDQDSLALEVAKDYMHNYLDKLTNYDFCTKENIYFLNDYSKMIDTKDRIFRLYLEKPERVDSIMQERGYSINKINEIISWTIVQPHIYEASKGNKTPNWTVIKRVIKKRFNKDIANTNVINAKVGWYRDKKEWSSYLNALMQKWQIDSVEFIKFSWLYLNDIAWTVCVHSNKRNQLKISLKWADMAILKLEKLESGVLDTKANILYKLGHKKEAITLEKRALGLADEESRINTFESEKEYYARLIKHYQNIVNKMEKGELIDLKY